MWGIKSSSKFVGLSPNIEQTSQHYYTALTEGYKIISIFTFTPTQCVKEAYPTFKCISGHVSALLVTPTFWPAEWSIMLSADATTVMWLLVALCVRCGEFSFVDSFNLVASATKWSISRPNSLIGMIGQRFFFFFFWRTLWPLHCPWWNKVEHLPRASHLAYAATSLSRLKCHKAGQTKFTVYRHRIFYFACGRAVIIQISY